MENFSNDFMSYLRNGASFDDLSKALAAAKTAYEKEQSEAAQKAAETKRGDAIAAMATNMIRRQMTREDLALCITEYAYQCWPNLNKVDANFVSTMFDADVIHDMINEMVESVERLSDIVKTLGIQLSKEDLANAASKAKKNMNKDYSMDVDAQAIQNFIDKLLN